MYTISRSKIEDDQKSRTAIVELLRSVVFNLNSDGASDDPTPLPEVDHFAARFGFAWCFWTAWVATSVGVIAGALSWALSLRLNRKPPRRLSVEDDIL